MTPPNEDDELNEIENEGTRFTAKHLLAIQACHDESKALLYSGAMAAATYNFIKQFYGPRTAINLMQGLAIIRAELIGSETCSAEGITVEGHAPVLALCRKLIEAGYDPVTRLECYRGDTLCLTVRSIGEGANLRITTSTIGRPTFDHATAKKPTQQPVPLRNLARGQGDIG